MNRFQGFAAAKQSARLTAKRIPDGKLNNQIRTEDMFMNKDTRGHTTPNKDAIAYNAYLLWEKEGCPAGRDQEYWFKAESQLRSMIHKQELTPIKPSEISPMQGKSRHNSRMPERA